LFRSNPFLTHISVPLPQVLRELALSNNPELRVVSLPNVERIQDSGREWGPLFIDVGNTQPDVRLPKLSEVGGEVHVAHSGELSWLQGLRSVGSLYLEDNEFENLASFAALEEIKGDLSAVDQRGLLSVTGLSQLRRIGGSIFLRESRYSGMDFPALTSVGGIELVGLTIRGTIHFPKLERIEQGLHLVRVEALPDGPTFPSLRMIGGSLNVEDNPNGKDLVFSALEEVGGELTVERSGYQALELPSLTSIDGRFVVLENPEITRVAVPSLSRVGGHLILANNPKLPQCLVDGIAHELDGRIGGDTATTGNDESGVCQ